MRAVESFPKVTGVEPRPGKKLVVDFDNGERRVYDCSPLLALDAFRPLRDEALFKCARPDATGCGVVWTDEIDLAESELWLCGEPPRPGP